MKINNIVCPSQISWMLDNALRRWIHNPHKLLGNYIKNGMHVLDVGCGPGFFSVGIAKMVGKSGKVIAADLQEGMLKKLRNKIKGTELEKRVKLHKCRKDKIGVSEKVDLALAFYMVHEVPDPGLFLKEIKSLLKPKGKLIIIEPYFHASKKEFEENIRKAVKMGFKPIERPNVLFSRAVVLRK